MTNERIARLGAMVLSTGVKALIAVVSPAPAEWGIQQKCSRFRICKPAEENGRAYSSREGR
jgi:hypothetical protein